MHIHLNMLLRPVLIKLPFDDASFHIYFKNSEDKLDFTTIRFLHASEDAVIRPTNKLSAKVSYYNGPDSNSWYEAVPIYEQLIYENIYDGIDVKFYGNNEGKIEFDFILAPWADPDQIRIESSDNNVARITEKGNILLTEEMILEAPYVYQQLEEERTEIPGFLSYRSSWNILYYPRGFMIIVQILIIDPVLSYATYFGGPAASENVADITIDDEGHVYMTGTSDFSNQFYIVKFLPGQQNFELLLWLWQWYRGYPGPAYYIGSRSKYTC